MIRIKKSIVDAVQNAVTPQDLYPSLQLAISLELATIPAYLSGLFTLKQTGTNQVNAGVSEIITSVVNEEMLHMCIAANALTALGGSPIMNTQAVVPTYPGPLPGDTDDGLIVHLRPFSADAVLDTYMRIEEPDTIIQPSGQAKIPLAPAPPPQPGQSQSIGDFYRAIVAKLQTLPASSINSDPNSSNQKNQVVEVFFTSPQLPAAITDINSAVASLNIIIDQGEGSSVSPDEIDPLDPAETTAHFYRFAEIIMGKSIVISGSSYDFSGPSVTFDATTSSGVYNMYPDPTLAVMQTLLSAADFNTCQAFSGAFTALLDALNAVFNGNPQGINDVINNNMFSLVTAANNVLAIPVGSTGNTAGLCFEIFRPVS
jgi:hypothetical protein